MLKKILHSNVGSSSASFAKAIPILSWSAFDLGSIATSITGSGNSIDSRITRSLDIAAAVGLKDTTTGDTLCDEKDLVILESMEFPEPVIDVAIEPKSKADQDKMGILTNVRVSHNFKC